jgi:hypothetical protein
MDYRGYVDIEEIEIQKIQYFTEPEPIDEIAKSPAQDQSPPGFKPGFILSGSEKEVNAQKDG